MILRRWTSGILFLVATVWATGAVATELKVLSVEAMQPALQQLAPAFETTSKNKLKIDYATTAAVEKKIVDEEEYDVVIVDKRITTKLGAAAKIATGSIRTLAKQNADLVYDASSTNWCQEPGAAMALIDFLAKSSEVYKAKGLQPG